MIRTLQALLALVLLGVGFAPPAGAYGPATHAALGRKAAAQLAAADARFRFLTADAGILNCFLYGTTFPDVRGIAAGAATFDALKRRLEGSSLVRRVNLSTADVRDLDLDTHDRGFLFFLVDRAERSGDPAFLAFALGNLAHVGMDIHAQLAMVPYYMARTGGADVGIAACRSDAAATAHRPGEEVENFVEGMLDYVRSASEVRFPRDASRSLDRAGVARSLQRATAVRRLYYLAAKEYHDVRLGRRGFISEAGFHNSAQLFDAALVVLPFATGKESAAGTARTFKDRYMELTWLGGVLYNVVSELILGSIGAGDLLSGIALVQDRVAGALGGDDPTGAILAGVFRGGQAQRSVASRYGQAAEYQRLVQSGLLSRGTYTEPLDDGVAFARDLVARRAASRLGDEGQWAVWSSRVNQAGAIGGLARLLGPASGHVAEPALLVSGVRFLDAATGAEVRTLRYPQDAGRALRVEVELFAPVADARALVGGRAVRVAVRSDRGAGRADPVAGEGGRTLGAAELTPAAYGLVAKPRLSLDFTAPGDVGQAGLYVELDAGRGVFFTTNLAPFAALMAGRPHYARHYATYGAYPPAVKVER